jgi:hypothetical protein
MNVFNKIGRMLTCILSPCYSKGFVFEDAYQDDDMFNYENIYKYNYDIYNHALYYEDPHALMMSEV